MAGKRRFPAGRDVRGTADSPAGAPGGTSHGDAHAPFSIVAISAVLFGFAALSWVLAVLLPRRGSERARICVIAQETLRREALTVVSRPGRSPG
jgi:hypothetical protein